MKNRNYIKIALLLFAVSMTSCKKSFLEEKPTQFLTPDQLTEASNLDPALLNGNVAGLYSTMYSTGVGGTTGHDDFGQKGIDIYTDMLASDMALTGVNYGWYSQLVRYQATTNSVNNVNYVPWRYYYRIIFSANILIEALGGNEMVPEDAESRYNMGQAKAMRAYAYYYLSQLYAKTSYNESEKILPIYTDTKVPNQPKSTAKEVFDLMVKDLDDAIMLLEGFNRPTKSSINKYVAEGLLAYVLAARGTAPDLQRVITLTGDIMTNGGFSLTSRSQSAVVLSNTGSVTNPESGFNDVNTASWMWGTDITLAMGLDLVSWWGQIDVYTYSYAWAGDPKAIDNGLYVQIPGGDVRKNQFSPTNFQPRGKFFAPNRVIGGQRNITTDYLYMRLDEIYLLNAEAYARLNNDAMARQSLKVLLALRLDDSSYIDNLSGQALKDEIYLQTRIELWGEGKVYLALKRNQRSTTRGNNHLFNVGETVQYNDAKITFSIPQAEVLNNPNLNN